MSNWLPLLLTESRSSARSAPISYTPPVKPPPPSTSAVRDWRPRAERRRPPAAPFSSLTTLPIAPSVYWRDQRRAGGGGGAALNPTAPGGGTGGAGGRAP